MRIGKSAKRVHLQRIELDGRGNVRGASTGGRWTPVPGAASARAFDATRLVGHEAYVQKPPFSGEIVRVYAEEGKVNSALLRQMQGDERRAKLTDLCADTSTGLEEIPTSR